MDGGVWRRGKKLRMTEKAYCLRGALASLIAITNFLPTGGTKMPLHGELLSFIPDHLVFGLLLTPMIDHST